MSLAKMNWARFRSKWAELSHEQGQVEFRVASPSQYPNWVRAEPNRAQCCQLLLSGSPWWTLKDQLPQRHALTKINVSFFNIHLFPDNLGDSACISEIVQATSAVRQFGGRSGMIRQPQCRNWLHFYRITCRLSKTGRKKGVVMGIAAQSQSSTKNVVTSTKNRQMSIIAYRTTLWS